MSYTRFKFAVEAIFTADPSDHDDQREHMAKIEADFESFRDEMEAKYGYGTRNVVPFKALIEMDR